MSSITLDQELRAKLNGMNETISVRDEAGNEVGVFLPVAAYRKFLARHLDVPLTEEEIERRRGETGGTTLAEFWKRMGRE